MTTHDPNDLRDPRFDAAWRATSHEEPPPALDDAIRAAARREVHAGPQTAKARAAAVPSALRPERWWMPLAAAATIGVIAVGVLQLAGPDKVGGAESDKRVVSDIPATQEKANVRADNDKHVVPDTPAATEPAQLRAQTARDEAAPKNAPAPAAPASSIAPAAPPVRQGPPVGGDARNRVMPTPPTGTPAPVPTLRKDAGAASTFEQRAATKPLESPPARGASGGAQVGAGVTDAAKPAAPVAEPFPADAQKREAKDAASNVAPPASPPTESAAAGLASGKLVAPPPTSMQKQKALERDAPPASAPVTQFAQPATSPTLPTRRLQESDAARSPAPKPDAANEVAGATADVRAKTQPKLAVPDWIALIRKLRDENRIDDAAKELAAFRAAYPEHERLLPPDLRDWKPGPR